MPTPTQDSSSDIGLQTLCDVLVKIGALSPDRAKQIKLAEIQTGKSKEEMIVEQNLVSEENLIKARAILYNIPFVDLATIPNSPEAISALPQEIAQRFKVFPVSIDTANKTLVLAMADPLDLTAIEFIEQK